MCIQSIYYLIGGGNINIKNKENLAALRLKMLKDGESKKKTNDFIRDLRVLFNTMARNGIVYQVNTNLADPDNLFEIRIKKNSKEFTH